MPILNDCEISEAELVVLRDRADSEWDSFWNGLTWRPIGEYDKTSGARVILAAGDHWRFGFWGGAPDSLGEDALPGWSFWREAQDCALYSTLTFLPERFAEVDEDWAERLSQD